MRPNPEFVEEAARALAQSPFRDSILAPWGLSHEEVKPYRVGLYDNALTIPHYDRAEKLEGVKLRLLGKSHDDPNRFRWLTKGKAPALFITPGALDAQIVIVAEGPLKAIAFEVITERAVCGLASGVQTGIPDHGRELFRGKDVWLIHDPDEAGFAAPATLVRQLRGIAASLRAIPYPPHGWGFRGQPASDVNDVLRLIREAYRDQWRDAFEN